MPKTKHIHISRTRKNQPWAATIPTSALHTTGTANGIKYATTRRNYFLDTAKNKLRYQTMSCEGASYNLLVDIYMEVPDHPGLYVFTSIATENSISDVLERYSQRLRAVADPKQDLTASKRALAEWYALLTWIN